MKSVEIIRRRRIFDDVFKIEEARLRFERYDGRMSDEVRRLNFERGDSAAAIVLNTDRKTVYLIEQFRFPALGKAGGWLIEIVAGVIDPGETAAQSIRREIREEIGFAATMLDEVGAFFVSPGGSSERVTVFCARVSDADRVAAGGGLATEGEDIKLIEWPLPEFFGKLDAHEFKDAKTVIAGYWLKANQAAILGGR